MADTVSRPVDEYFCSDTDEVELAGRQTARHGMITAPEDLRGTTAAYIVRYIHGKGTM